MSEVLTISSLKEIYNSYDTFILDQWGVMHDGVKGYLKAIKCVEKLFSENKNLIIVSNSSKRKKSSLNTLSVLGFNSDHFKEVMTSGEMIWQSLSNENYNLIQNLGKNCFHICDQFNEEGKDFLKGLEKYKLVENIDESDFILACTPFSNTKVLDYVPILDIAIKKHIPFLCANPDFETISTPMNMNENNIFCMGAIAELYKSIGGKIFLLGKPNIDIYIESTKNIKKLKKSRILAIGDSLHHDIKGAIKFGIDSLLITSTGIHHRLFDKKNPNWDNNSSPLLNMDIKPNFICSEFIF